MIKSQLGSEIISEHENIRFVPYEQIPDTVKNLYLVSEDQQFFTHLVFDPASMMRAVFINAKNQSIVQSESTITQQLARCGVWVGKIKMGLFIPSTTKVHKCSYGKT